MFTLCIYISTLFPHSLDFPMSHVFCKTVLQGGEEAHKTEAPDGGLASRPVITCWLVGRNMFYPLANWHNHGTSSFFWGTTHHFDWAIFNSYVKLPEGICSYTGNIIIPPDEVIFFRVGIPSTIIVIIVSRGTNIHQLWLSVNPWSSDRGLLSAHFPRPKTGGIGSSEPWLYHVISTSPMSHGAKELRLEFLNRSKWRINEVSQGFTMAKKRRSLKLVSTSSHKDVQEVNPLINGTHVKNRSNTERKSHVWRILSTSYTSQPILVCLFIQHRGSASIDRDCKNVKTSQRKPMQRPIGIFTSSSVASRASSSLHHRGTCCFWSSADNGCLDHIIPLWFYSSVCGPWMFVI